MTEAPKRPLIRVDRLTVVAQHDGPPVPLLQDVSLDIGPGETLGLVGASGGGKSMLARAILRLLPPACRPIRGSIVWRGRDLLVLPEPEMPRIRGAEIALVVQEPLGALNPVLPIGRQIEETLRVHRRATDGGYRTAAVELLERVQLTHADRRLLAYPHQLSGGERQRVVVALALAGSPSLLIADEPTTALDVITQAGVLALLRTLVHELDLALLLISHDFDVIASCADRVAVLHEGTIVEEGPVGEVRQNPKHEHTKELLTIAD